MMTLTLRPTWPDEPRRNDWTVLDDGEVVGRIYQNDATPQPESRWYWCLNGGTGEALQHGIRGSGLAASLDAAKAAWRASYDRWLEWKNTGA